jgi:hypothetical protein
MQQYNINHTHCFDQGESPACGIPLEKHGMCCLCGIRKDLLGNKEI